MPTLQERVKSIRISRMLLRALCLVTSIMGISYLGRWYHLSVRDPVPFRDFECWDTDPFTRKGFDQKLYDHLVTLQYSTWDRTPKVNSDLILLYIENIQRPVAIAIILIIAGGVAPAMLPRCSRFISRGKWVILQAFCAGLLLAAASVIGNVAFAVPSTLHRQIFLFVECYQTRTDPFRATEGFMFVAAFVVVIGCAIATLIRISHELFLAQTIHDAIHGEAFEILVSTSSDDKDKALNLVKASIGGELDDGDFEMN